MRFLEHQVGWALLALVGGLAVGCVRAAAPARPPVGTDAQASATPLSAVPTRLDDRAAFARLLAALQTLDRDPPPPLLVSPRSALDAVRAAILLRALRPELEQRARLYAARLAAPPVLRLPIDAPPVRTIGQQTPAGASRGLAWAAPAGADVRSPADGVIEFAGPVRGYGVVLILQISGGYHLVLAGLDAAEGGVGRQVAAGDRVGQTAAAGAPRQEVYLELRRNGSPVNPAPFIVSAPSHE